MRLPFLLVTFGALVLAACGDDATGPAPPNLVGAYDGTWTVTVEGSGLETTTEDCAGTVSITEQSGGAFQGAFSQAASEICDAASGSVTGTVTSDGGVSLLLGASGGGGPGFEESTGCTILSADDRDVGSWADGTLSFDTSLTAECPESGSTPVTWTFAFAGS